MISKQVVHSPVKRRQVRRCIGQHPIAAKVWRNWKVGAAHGPTQTINILKTVK